MTMDLVFHNEHERRIQHKESLQYDNSHLERALAYVERREALAYVSLAFGRP